MKKARPENSRQSAEFDGGWSHDGLRKAQLSGGSGARVSLTGPGFSETTPLEQVCKVGSPRIPEFIDWYWLLIEHGVENQDLRS